MIEPIRLVIWDLDDTFWRGTLTEGGVESYIQAHHDLVIELARRGILSSICSKNDHDEVRQVLEPKGLWDYFIFPSISWEPKGPRIAALIEDVQLRAVNVLFIDDNPTVRAEAAAHVPGLQTADPSFIPEMLHSPLLKGKPDPKLMRLAQYRLLQRKQRDKNSASDGNEAFLRGCDIRVSIVRDLDPHLDCIFELINRTNQLNYTKRRFPDDPEEARRALRTLLNQFDCQAGLVHVADRYGDYGFVGFFATMTQRERWVSGTSNTRLEHFCFSCRTLGMLIETWIYEHLGRPELEVVGEVHTDLNVEKTIDWVRLVDSMDTAAVAESPIADHIVVYGGCEAHILSAYLTAYAPRVSVFGNYAANGTFVRTDTSAGLLERRNRIAEEYATEAVRLGVPLELEAVDLFQVAGENSLIILNLTTDAGEHVQVRHRSKNWLLVLEPRGEPGANFIDLGRDRLTAHLETYPYYSDEQRRHLIDVSGYVRDNYEVLPPLSSSDKMALTREIIESVPRGSRLVFIVNHDQERQEFPSEQLTKIDVIDGYVEGLERLVSKCSYAAVTRVTQVIEGIDDLREANHYARAVYLRIAELVRKTAAGLTPRTDAPVSFDERQNEASPAADQDGRRQEVQDLVTAGYQCLLRRDPEEGAVEHHSERILNGEMSLAQFLRNITACEEFVGKCTFNE